MLYRIFDLCGKDGGTGVVHGSHGFLEWRVHRNGELSRKNPKQILLTQHVMLGVDVV